MKRLFLRSSRTCLTAAIIVLVAAAGSARSSNWPAGSEPNVALSTAFDRQELPRVASDGSGGAVVVWQDLRNQLDWNLFAQRIDAYGNVLWTQDGVSVSSAVFNQTGAQIIADGAGGAIVVWEDTRGGAGIDIYAQRIDADGMALWTADGVVVCEALLDQQAPQLVSDGAGGAIVVWEDIRTGVLFDIYAQRIDASGTALWTADGVAVNEGVWGRLPSLAPDGAGGAVIAWEDSRNGPVDVYAQRIDADGNDLWTANGVAVRSVAWTVSDVHVVPSISNGAIILWEDAQFADHDIDGCRVIGDGTVLSVFNVSAGLGDHRDAHVVADGAGGAVVAYSKDDGGDDGVAVQRVGLSGSLWNGGLPVTFTAPGSLTERNPRIAADASGGAVVVWGDDRYGTSDLFAVGLANDGTVTWGVEGSTDGLAVTTAVGSQFAPQLVADDNGGAVFVWQDERVNSFSDDVYAQRIEGNGYSGYPSGDITTIVDVPQDNGGSVILSWSASVLDDFPNQVVTHYSVWRSPDPVSASAPENLDAVDLSTRERELHRAAVAGGIAPALAAQQAAAGWNFVDTQTASYLGEYAYQAPTFADSTGAGGAPTSFMVITHTADAFVFWKSAPADGYSVDNLAPAPPIHLVGTTESDDARLDWQPPEMNNDDIAAYNVYRSQLAGVTATPETFLASVPDLTLLDTTTGGQRHYYVVTAVDLSDQESDPSNEVAVPVVTGIDDGSPAAPPALTLRPGVPNPFSGATTMLFGLPESADVTVAVYDVAGRVVFRDRIAHSAAGWSTYTFDGRRSSGTLLPSGVYFLRMSTPAGVQVKKVTIAR